MKRSYTPARLKLERRPWRPGYYITEFGTPVSGIYQPEFYAAAKATESILLKFVSPPMPKESS